MGEYLSTAELAKYLKLNQKKVYAMVADGQLPAVRISGKWLFPRELVDRWLTEHTVYPPSAVMDALLDRLLVLQGSDDWLLSRVLEHIQRDVPVPTATVGSVAGLQALASGQAHVASCHVEPSEVREQVAGPAYLVDLFDREQGLIYDPARTPRLDGLAAACDPPRRFAVRQPQSGTARLVDKLLRQAKLQPTWTRVGPMSSHLELALAIRDGDADVGIGIRMAAHKTGLAFTPLASERFSLAVPAPFFSHPRMVRFLELAMDGIRSECKKGMPGYSTAALGHLQPIGG